MEDFQNHINMEKKFGNNFLNEVLYASFFQKKWENISILPYNDTVLKISSNAVGLNYAVSVFEGIRATPINGKFNVFRLKDHLDRLNLSCERMCIPLVGVNQLYMSIYKVLESIDIDVITSLESNNQYIYIRPVVFNKENILDISAEEQFQMNVYFSITDNYISDGGLITINSSYPRALSSLGNIKTSGNYGHMLYSMKKAKGKGFNQELWLDFDKKYVQELSTMNFFFKTDNKIFTPSLSDQILSGITRDTIISICKEMNIEVIESRIDIKFLFDSLLNDIESEIFGTGTASGLISFRGLNYEDKTLTTVSSSISDKLRNKLFEKYKGIEN